MCVLFLIFFIRVWFSGLCFYDVDDLELMSEVSFLVGIFG